MRVAGKIKNVTFEQPPFEVTNLGHEYRKYVPGEEITVTIVLKVK
jgi:hypothetical protein